MKTIIEVNKEFEKRGYNPELSAPFFANAAWQMAIGKSMEEATGHRTMEEQSKKDLIEVSRMIEL
jgi:hypothetical protein